MSAAASTRLRAPLGDWLTSRRVRLCCAVLLALEIAGFLFLVAGTHGWIVRLEQPTTTDFVSFYAAGALADAGTPALAYDQAAHLAAEERAAAPGIEYQYFNYPPVFLLLCAGLAQLPYLAAFLLFEGVTLGLYLLVARRIAASTDIIVILLAFPPLFWNFGLGQNAYLTAALFGAATLLIDARPVLAGVCFGALAYKPHFALLAPFALAAGGHWRAFAAAALTAAALVLVSLAWFGEQTWRDFLAVAGEARQMYESGRILFGGFVSPFGGVRLLGGSVAPAYAVQAIATVAAAASVVVVWRSRRSLPLRAAVLISATAVAVPLSLIYDLALTALAVLWLLRDREHPLEPVEKTVLALLFLATLLPPQLAGHWHVPVLPAAALILFALVLRRAWRERHPTAPRLRAPT